VKPTLTGVVALLISSTAVSGSLPDPKITPGAITADVTQAMIQQPVCVNEYAQRIRPSAYRQPHKQELPKRFALGRLPMNEISPWAFKSAAELIKSGYGDLHDFPKELANTICNLHYLSYLLLENPNGHTHFFKAFIGTSKESYLEDFKQWTDLVTRSVADTYTIDQSIRGLRDMRSAIDVLPASMNAKDKEFAKYTYDFFVTVELDRRKYEIKDVNNKTSVRRAIERKLKTPREIPNLVDLMDEAGYAIWSISTTRLKEHSVSSDNTTLTSQSREKAEKIIIECPVCHQRLRVPSGRQGRVTCSKCEHVFEVGGTSTNSEIAETCLRKGLKCQAEKDYPEAVQWLRKAANLENAQAQFNLAVLYASGMGMPQDNEYAALLFRKAANQGIAAAQFNLGVMYREGAGVERDFAEAASWLQKAAIQGNAEAQFDLAYLYAQGRGVPRDDDRALRLLQAAADQGNSVAEYTLAILKDQRPSGA
jgi:hypothetical protein